MFDFSEFLRLLVRPKSLTCINFSQLLPNLVILFGLQLKSYWCSILSVSSSFYVPNCKSLIFIARTARHTNLMTPKLVWSSSKISDLHLKFLVRAIVFYSLLKQWQIDKQWYTLALSCLKLWCMFLLTLPFFGPCLLKKKFTKCKQ